MAERVICVKCGNDLTTLHAEPGPRKPCPKCRGLVRRFETRASLSGVGRITVTGTAHRGGEPAVETAPSLAGYFQHQLTTVRAGDELLIELKNPDTGVLDFTITLGGNVPEALKWLGGPLRDDVDDR